jgi:hypothetical protein
MPQIALAAYAVYQGVQSGKQADRDRETRDAATGRATAIGLEDRDYYRKKFGPVNQMLIDYAMGNKPSPYLARAKGQVESGFQKGMTQLNEIQGRSGLGASGIGEGQKIGLGMERAKILAGLDLQDQSQRYGVAQSLSGMENNSLQGSATAARGYGLQASYAGEDMGRSLNYQDQMFQGAAGALGGYVENLSSGGNMLGMKAKQEGKIEAGGSRPAVANGGWSLQGGVGAGGFTGKLS